MPTGIEVRLTLRSTPKPVGIHGFTLYSQTDNYNKGWI